ncbi:MAG: RIP metalloprotease RseP [Syntrophorhabdales bacterium]|jgi:regulator of sigma E protease
MMITVLSFLVVLTVLVLAHELGHLVAAKRLGIRVETFAIGFGPRVAAVRRGDTKYVLRLIPLGGYVQLGEAGQPEAFCPGSPHYADRPPFHKIVVASSGPLANLSLAVLVLFLVSLLGVSAPVFMSQPAAVGWVASASPAEKAGLRSGDKVCGVDGIRVATWGEVTRLLPLYEKDVTMRILRDGETEYLTLHRASRINAGLFAKERITVAAVAEGSPAQGAGIRAGDVILTAGGSPVAAWSAFQAAIAGARAPLPIGIERLGRSFVVRIVPRSDPRTGKAFAGISYSPLMETRKYPFPAAMANGFSTFAAILGDSIGSFRGILSGSLSAKMLGGPIAIAQASGTVAKKGLVPLLSFLAFLSVQFAVFNLVPFFPVVDGGQITIFLLEMVRRRPLGRAPLEWMLKVGWAAMAALVLFVTYNDVARLF